MVDHRPNQRRHQLTTRRSKLGSVAFMMVAAVIVVTLVTLSMQEGTTAAVATADMTTTSASLVATKTADASVASPAVQPIPITQTWEQVLSDTGGPIAQSSPTVATLDGGGPSIVVGDRAGNVYAFHLSNGTAPAGWSIPVLENAPVDSTPSVVQASGGLDNVFVGSGNAFDPTEGGYQAFGPSGKQLWYTPVIDPGADTSPAFGVQASLTVGSFGGQTGVMAGSLDQQAYALHASDGASFSGWPWFPGDSVFSTAAWADLYSNGQDELVEGGASTAGVAYGRTYTPGGHIRVLTSRGGLVCQANTNETVDSSPAVGSFLDGGATGIVTGTGTFYSGVSDLNTVKAYNTLCQSMWTATLDGGTYSSPALADVQGNGQLQVVEGTDNGTTGSVYALNGTNGATIWKTSVIGRVIGSVVTADLTGAGYQDVLVPTTNGLEILNGKTGAFIEDLATSDMGLQDSPLVTEDPNGTIGITLAGYNGANQGKVEHYEVTGSNGSAINQSGAWPMFHHDPQLSGNAGTTAAPESACQNPTAINTGYNEVASDGGVFSFGGQPFCGSTGSLTLNKPVVGMAMAPASGGYWFVASDGGVFAFGGAKFYGSMGGKPLNKPIVGMDATPDGKGYWLVASDGGIFAYGDATFYGSASSSGLTITGLARTGDGLGYWEVASNGAVYTFGNAQYQGAMNTTPLNAPIIGITLDPGTGGYWLIGSDGGVFSFDAPFYGSEGGKHLNAPIVAMASTLDGYGYWFVASDGGVFAYGDAKFSGSMGGRRLNKPVVAMAGF